jgi:hypothetical protein
MVNRETEPVDLKLSEPEKIETGWTPRDWIAAVALFAATAAVVLWQNAHVAVLFDLSYILNTAERIACGQVPYRDFPLAHAPLTFLIQAAIIRLTGRVVFHHVLYAAFTGGVGTVVAWRIALRLLRGRVAGAWTIALLLAAPLVFLGVYSIVPNPEYDCDCGFWLVVALWFFTRFARTRNQGSGVSDQGSQFPSYPARTEDGCVGLKRSAALAFAAGAAACVPIFFKQNMGLPFLLTAIGAVLLCGIVAKLETNRLSGIRDQGSGCGAVLPGCRSLVAFFCGACAALAAGILTIASTAGLGNYLRWTIQYAGRRRMPGVSLMLGVYSDPMLLWALPCVAVALLLLRAGIGKKLWARIAAFALLAAPFVWTLASLARFDDADSRGDALLALWPPVLVLAAVLAVVNLLRACFPNRFSEIRSFPQGLKPHTYNATSGTTEAVPFHETIFETGLVPRRGDWLRAFLPLVVLAAIHGTFLSQQLWGSTYGIWPLLILLVAELLAFLGGSVPRAAASRWFAPALAAVIAVTLLVCGGFYVASEERLSYAFLPEGPAAHSAFPELAGLATPGPYVPEIDELLRYAQANIPFEDGIVLIPGEEPFYFATGRTPRFPVPFFDPTIDPYSPAEIAALMRSRKIRWLIVKTDVQTKENPATDQAAILQMLMPEVAPVAHLGGYDVYRVRTD